MFLLFTAVALQAAVRLPKTSAVDGLLRDCLP